ncbi:TetR family transcriptional regulator C-terminal domain-containing protein [Aureibacter tunicatorum]|uniref:Tetracyclin repressor-like C-terminal domain-containing protein n=1 Tax=Aureibacter tunicatorum TaxID=866807 RepID=A0AAE3XKU4_9BACT|nr:TetR family transcriptional regulator C-terminal domain-containing protein [Aureibacter tunicatorum]MDR6238370.1 hypothetical protein [Aureibacter tunicatorum]BDD03402.1 hypothetical protein AUTU_08850 [Aureibacter tunicatorum]
MTKEKIFEWYMNDSLENNQTPSSVYLFCKNHEIEETEFYKFFGSLDNIEKHIFANMFDHTLEVLSEDPNYVTYDFKSKLLAFYFTFFEVLKANRSFVMLSINSDKPSLKNLTKLGLLRENFKKYISSIDHEITEKTPEKLKKAQEKNIEESFWIQLLITLKFWLDDDSAGFEKTDIFIEKSVNAGFELLNTNPLENTIDFGKFLFKERFND